MPIPKPLLLINLLFVLAFISSCHKSEDDPPLPTKTELLVANEWQGSKALINGIDVELIKRFQTAIPASVVNTIPDVTSLRLAFFKDGTYKATFVENGAPQTSEGTWEFKENETRIELAPLGELEIQSLTEANFNVSRAIQQGGITYLTEIYFSRP